MLRVLSVLSVPLGVALAVWCVWDVGAVAVHEGDVGGTRGARYLGRGACCRSTIEDCLLTAFESVVELPGAGSHCCC